MFGNISQIASLLKNAGQIKENMKLANARLTAARFIGEAGGGQVQATVDGKGEPISIKFEPMLLESKDTEMIEELTVAALRDAIHRSREGAKKELEAAAGGVDISGVMDMFNK
jgi:DNA-binding YbaB/EbfC family protein